MIKRVAVMGAGSWGTTVASLLSERVSTVLWARRQEVVEDISNGRGNQRYLPGVDLPDELCATTDVVKAVEGADLVLVAVPSHGFRQVLVAAQTSIASGIPVISLAKGFEQGTYLRMTQVVSEVIPDRPVGVLTGPNIAREILLRHSAATVVACNSESVAKDLQFLLTSERLRVYTNDDIVGCEIGGAVKNVIALASGVAEGLGTGDNARAALITRGLAELTRLGEALGSDPRTLTGLAGLGDVLVTCISRQSRNRWFGEQIGSGRSVEEILNTMNQVAEGVRSAGVVCELASQVGVEVPIAQGVRAVIDDGRDPLQVWEELMMRQVRSEAD